MSDYAVCIKLPGAIYYHEVLGNWQKRKQTEGKKAFTDNSAETCEQF